MALMSLNKDVLDYDANYNKIEGVVFSGMGIMQR